MDLKRFFFCFEGGEGRGSFYLCFLVVVSFV